MSPSRDHLLLEAERTLNRFHLYLRASGHKTRRIARKTNINRLRRHFSSCSCRPSCVHFPPLLATRAMMQIRSMQIPEAPPSKQVTLRQEQQVACLQLAASSRELSSADRRRRRLDR